MRRRDNRHENERLRDLLRSGDPAADGSDPSPAELAVWKRETLNSVTRGRRWPAALTWALATSAAAVLVALLVLLRPDPPQDSATGTPTVATGKGLQTTEEPAREQPPQEDGQPGTMITQQPDTDIAVATPQRRVDLPAKPGTEQPTAPAAVPAAARTIQFTTPKGTRIIWTLDPEFSLPDTGETT